MRSKLSDRIKEARLKKKVIGELLGRFKYAVLALTALWMSAWFGGACNQFLVLSIILGLKWVFPGQKQIIQIFTQEGGANEGE
jgi:type IV secretory pathway VirB2 component (pilin)